MPDRRPGPPRRFAWGPSVQDVGRTSPVGPYATCRLATTHPVTYLTVGALVVLAGGSAALLEPAPRLVWGTRLLLAAFAVAAGLIAAAPGIWPTRHRVQAAQAVDVRTRQDVQSFQRHPILGFVVLPVVLAAALAWRNEQYLAGLSRSHLIEVLNAGVLVLAGLRWVGFVIERRRLHRQDGHGTTPC